MAEFAKIWSAHLNGFGALACVQSLGDFYYGTESTGVATSATAERILNQSSGPWVATIPLKDEAGRIDFFSNHRKLIAADRGDLSTYLSSPYTGVEL